MVRGRRQEKKEAGEEERGRRMAGRVPMTSKTSLVERFRVSFRKLSKGGGGGGGGMMVKDVIKFHKCHLRGRDMLECVCVYVCVCAGFHTGF